MEARRKGIIKEYQNGRWFLYHIIWEENVMKDGTVVRPHEEYEVYHNTSKLIGKSESLKWYSTDIKTFENALSLFYDDPKTFERK